MEQSTGATYTGQDTASTRGSVWVTLEQEYRGEYDDYADIATAMGMIQAVSVRGSAMEQLREDCVYASVSDGVVTVVLEFYVWPSSMDLQYGVTANQGVVSDPTVETQHRSFDVIFNGRDYVEIPYIMDGSVSRSMPRYTPLGQPSKAEFTLDGAVVNATEDVYCVLRADGTASGYKHSVTMRFTSEDTGEDSRITSVSCEVTVTHLDDNGETATQVLQLDVPQCVIDLLSWCEEDDSLEGILDPDDDKKENPELYVWYSTCEEDEILKEQWVYEDE